MLPLRVLSLLIVGLMFAMSFWARGYLPEDMMAVHFNIHGQPEGFMPRDTGLFMMPAIALFLTLIALILPKLMPKKGSLERSVEAYTVTMIATLFVLLVIHFLLLAEAFGSRFDVMVVALAAIGLLFMVIGNYLPKTRYNYIMGIRTPWTLADERVWDRTHRLGGPLFMLGGAATVVAAFALEPQQATVVMLAGVLAPAIVTIVYSWRVARQLGA